MHEMNDISNVIANIYEASYKPEFWPAALECIAKFTSSSSAGLLTQDKEIQKAGGMFAYNILDEDLAEYSRIEGGDPNFAIMAKEFPVGSAAAVDHVITDRTKLEQIYGEEYTSFVVSADYYYNGGAILFMDEVRSAAIALQRTRQMGVWSKSEMDRLNLIVPHLQRAINIHKEFIRLQTREQALRNGLDRLLMGLILFDKNLQPIYINPVAESILNYHPAISLKNNKVYAHEFVFTENIHKALLLAISSSKDMDPAETSTSMGLKHPNCATILPMIISPVEEMLHDFGAEGSYAHAVMCFSDPDRTHPIEAEKLADIYALTSAEASVAIAIANGIKPEEIAQMNNVAISTVRSHIKSIYQKLGINTQAELVKILLTGPFSQAV